MTKKRKKKKKTEKTGLDQFQSGFFNAALSGNRLRLPVADFWGQKPDRTGPADTTSTTSTSTAVGNVHLKSSTVGSSQSSWDVKPVQIQFLGGE